MAGEARRRRVRALLRAVGVDLDPEAIDLAFVHDSAVGHDEQHDADASNERLEWLGDSVLNLATARWLFKRYPQDREGELARRRAALVSDEQLAVTARRLKFGDVLVLGPGEAASGGAGRESILAGALEAFIGAVYRAGGFEAAARFIEAEHLSAVETAGMAAADPKTALQELTQARLGKTPTYEDAASGPAHRRTFTSRVLVGMEVAGEGIGPNKKLAQRAAAQVALDRLGEPHA